MLASEVCAVNELDFRLKSLPTSCLDIVPAATEDVTVERTLFAADIEQGNNTDVTFSIEGVRAGGIVKMIPGGLPLPG
jgi:D-ribose pyranose/furanose isomerase RbsD